MAALRPVRAAFVLLLAIAAAPVSGAEEASCEQSDETPLLQVHAAKNEAAEQKKKMKKTVPMPVNGPNVPLQNHTGKHMVTNVEVHNTIVVIPGNVIIGENVTAGSGNTESVNISTQLKTVLQDAAEAASSSAAQTAAKTAQEIENNKVELPRFISDGTKVWYQDENGKHILHFDPADCSACGCFYRLDGSPNPDGNYFNVTAEELASMEDSDDFTCEKYWPGFS